MDQEIVIKVICGILSVIALFAGGLYIFSFDNDMKDIDKRVDETEAKDELNKKKSRKIAPIKMVLFLYSNFNNLI